MNRQILFRGKRVDGKGTIEGNLFVPKENLRGVYISPKVTCCNLYPDLDDEDEISKEILDAQDGGIQIGKFYEVMPETVGQFTNKTDIKNVMIFEGDRVTGTVDLPTGKQKFTFEVVYSEDGFSVIANIFGSKTTPLRLSDVENIEVIGNIHD